MIPAFLVTALEIERSSDVTIQGVDGREEEQAGYVVGVELLRLDYFVGAVEVAATAWPFVLVGRDVLNDLVTEIHGPNLVFSITNPDASATTVQ